ncbi:MAG TPA: response regulator transcription factor [Candidatus Baltobacteraceae bacterium]|nr:response regulator transcription factor [Candidatus Baltobacteraceae bacterium]
MRILLVEDDPGISGPLASDLRRQAHVVEIAADGTQGLAYARSGVYDVVVLDIMLPGIDGLEMCRRLRAERVDTMILMLTAKDTVQDKVAALDAGADDYVPKPFDLAELSARIRALGRRSAEERNPIIEHGALALNPQNRSVRFRESAVNLTPTEFAILETLMRHPSRVFTRAMLLDKVAPFESAAGEGSIKTHITNIRRKVRAAGAARDPVVNVYGAGYRLATAE